MFKELFKGYFVEESPTEFLRVKTISLTRVIDTYCFQESNKKKRKERKRKIFHVLKRNLV